MPITLSASILSADFTQLGQQVRAAEAAGVDWIHCDVMDGQFVPNISMGPFVVETVRRITSLPLDVHLMIEHPERHLESFAQAGASTLSVHIEGNPNIYRTLQSIRALGARAGIVLNPGTPASAIEAVLPIVDMVLVMSVNPGYSGQSFIPAVLPKVAEVRTLLDRLNPAASIEVDGGVSAETLPDLYRAGAHVYVAATSIFKHPAGIAAGIQALRQAVPA